MRVTRRWIQPWSPGRVTNVGGILAPLFVFLLLIGLSACCTTSKLSSVPANWHVPQHTNTWCWAASTEMISDYYNHRINQCDSSRFVHNKPASCSQGCPDYCKCFDDHLNYADRVGCYASISDIKNNWTHWSFSYLYTSSDLSWADLKKSCSMASGCDKSPVQIIWWWTQGGGHVVTAYGYAETAGGNFVSYFNPWTYDCSMPNKDCSSAQTSGGEDAVATYEWMVSTADKTWGDSFSKFKYVGP
jgi:hypothetical protein